MEVSLSKYSTGFERAIRLINRSLQLCSCNHAIIIPLSNDLPVWGSVRLAPIIPVTGIIGASLTEPHTGKLLLRETTILMYVCA